MLFRSFLFASLVWLLVAKTLSAQSYITDSSTGQSLREKTIRLYTEKIGANALLYNAPEYIWLYPNTKGHPFYHSDTLQKGMLQYDSITYYDIPLLYEMVQQTIVIEGYQKTRIRLDENKIDAFSIGGHLFQKIDGEQGPIPDGFYEVLFQEEKIVALAKRHKETRRSFSPADPDEFREFAAYIIKKGKNFYTVDSEKSLLQALSDKKIAVKQFLKENLLSFRKEPAKTLVRAVAFYAKTNNQ